MPSIGVAIPCYKGHIEILKKLLDSIENQTRKPDSVVISCSSSCDEDIPYKQEHYSFPIKFVTTETKLNAAQNRNVAISYLDTDIISFIDADDQMHPQRLEIIEKAFKENNIVMLLHSFTTSLENFNNKIYDIDSINFDIGTIEVHSWGYECFNLKNNQAHIHNAQSSVSKHILKKIKYNEDPFYRGREDSVFTADVIKLHPKEIGYCGCDLSFYLSSSSWM